MSRRHRAEKREVLPDPKFGDMVVSKFMNSIMYAGKKSVAESIVYGAFDMIEFMNLVTTTFPNFGSGRISRFSALCRRDIVVSHSRHDRSWSRPTFVCLLRSPVLLRSPGGNPCCARVTWVVLLRIWNGAACGP